MPRLPEVLDRDALPEDKRQIFDYMAETRGAVRLPFSVLLNLPELCYRMAHVGSYIRFESSLPDRVREIAILSAAREMDARYEFAGHARLAKQVGVDDATIDLIANSAALNALGADDQLPVKAARELLGEHKLHEETFAAAQSKYGDRGAMELIGTIAYYTMLACMLNGLDIEPAADVNQLPPR